MDPINPAQIKAGDLVRRTHVHDGTALAGRPIGPVFRVDEIVDHVPGDGPRTVGGIALLEGGSHEFVWNLHKEETRNPSKERTTAMTIYELEKQATPKPWTIDVDYDAILLIAPEGGILAHTYGPAEDLELAAHCRNNFLRALEALKEEHENHHAKDENHGTGIYCSVCKLIAELENVE